jgi:hypothetical protein
MKRFAAGSLSIVERPSFAALKKVWRPIDVSRAIRSLIEGSELIPGHAVICGGGMTLGALQREQLKSAR